MEYDPVKFRLAKLLKRSTLLRKLFFFALDTLFLRAWYVRRELYGLKSRFKGDMTILDAGMGFGQYSERMLNLFHPSRLIGLEIDKSHLYGSENYFRTQYPNLRFVLGDVQILPLADKQFDLILSVDVMEHIEDDMATFSEFYRTLKAGGIFVMHTPRIQSDAEDEGDHDHWEVGEHVRDGYRDSEVRERLRKVGFDKVSIIRGYGLPGRIAWTLLQRIPMSMMASNKLLMIIPLAIYLFIISPFALAMMLLDLAISDHPRGGSLLVIAERSTD